MRLERIEFSDCSGWNRLAYGQRITQNSIEGFYIFYAFSSIRKLDNKSRKYVVDGGGEGIATSLGVFIMR